MKSSIFWESGVDVYWVFRRSVLPSSSGPKNKPREQKAASGGVLLLIGLLFDPDDRDGGSTFLQNVGNHLPHYTA
jgi:hypothetical protein